MNRYERGRMLGQGQYGVVYLGTCKETNEQVAIKKLRVGQYKHMEGVNFTALREIKLLKELNHVNVLRLHEAFSSDSNVYAVFELMESDLEKVIHARRVALPLEDIKSYMEMTIRGVQYLHERFVLHRDMKPNNLLIAADGVCKLADFGLARFFGSPRRPMTHGVVTIWYRAPELLYGARYYGGGVDMWAVGCIFAELLLRAPLLPGTTEVDQLAKIFHLRGTPTEENWPGHTHLPSYLEFNETKGVPLKEVFRAAPDDALDLLEQLLALAPARRITAADALAHAYFRAEPKATVPSELQFHKIRSLKAVEPSSPMKRTAAQSEAARQTELEPVKKRLNLFD